MISELKKCRRVCRRDYREHRNQINPDLLTDFNLMTCNNDSISKRDQ